ncbi:MAG: EAL domain-containing protein [Pseudomonadales bacterium]|nr:EAL domain-containing protein [Pseudomonadales bacterium]
MTPALSDRASFFRSLSTHLTSGKEAEQIVAVLVVRIRQIEEIVYEYGYSAGERIVDQIKIDIEGLLRPADAIYRLTGYDFGVILPAIPNAAVATLAADKISKHSTQQIKLQGNDIKISVAIGIATFPEHADKSSALHRCAEIAATQNEKKSEAFLVYSNQDEDSSDLSLSMVADLENAISNNEIQMHYQPQIDLRKNSVIGFEALARWNHESRGSVRPEIFVAVAENTGLILPLTLLTLNITLRESAELLRINDAYSVGFNLSASVLQEKNITEHIMNAVHVWNIRPEQLTLEVTETAIMENPDVARAVLEDLRSECIKISLDDFGTGYSSLGYLQALPINELKIDRSFVIDMMTSEGNTKIAQAIIDLAHNFDFLVVAEGIEDQETMKKLASLGCDLGQGYFVARPMPILDFDDWLLNTPYSLD